MVEMADTDYARDRGLMFRNSLAPEEGMLFAFDKDVLCSMWMKNMRFPLDMLWIDQNKKIVHIRKNVPTCTSSCEIITPPVSARYVIEVNAGFADKHQIKIADTVIF